MSGAATTLRDEMLTARRLTPDFGAGTLWLMAALFSTFFAATALAVSGAIPLWLGGAANAVFIYALYTVVHEAAHANISSRRKELRWVDAAAGVIASAPLWLMYHQHRRQHMAHHAHTNEDEDPDIYARGSFLGWVFLRLPVALLNYFNPVAQWRECRRFGCTARETACTAVTFAVYAAILAGLLAAGFWREVLALWFVPWWIGQTVMLTFFTWLPHHDHHETGRYRNTRVFLFPGADFLLQGQCYHLIHHMLPSVPWYRYRAVYEALEPGLRANGVRIEGVLPARTTAAAAPAA